MKFFDRVAFTTPTTGQGTLSVGAVLSDAFFTLAEQGAEDGDEVAFLIVDGTDVEIATGVLGDSLTTLTRAAVLSSKIGGTAGTTKLTLSGSAQVRLISHAAFLNGLIANVVEDTTPQLGGDLDLNGHGLVFPSATITDMLDEDDMASNSATKGATQQSIKAYADAKLDGALGSTDNRLLRADGTGGKTAQASAVAVDDSGNITAFGGQITFPASQNASADPNTLDDYEEGTWTPVLAFGGGSSGITYATRVGRYTKIGRFVLVTLAITLSNKGSSTGTAAINGLPFATAQISNFPGGLDDVTVGTGNLPQFDVLSGNTTVRIRYYVQSSGAGSQLDNGNFTNGSTVRFFLGYDI